MVLGADIENRRDRVGELNNADGPDDADQGIEVGDDGADDEGDGPVERNHEDPDNLAGLFGQRRHMEEFLADVCVDN